MSESDPRPQVARVTVAAWWISCPRCDEALSGQDGSQLIEATDPTVTPGAVKTCYACGATFRIPAKLPK